MADWLSALGAGEVVDVLVVAALCWLSVRLLRRTRARRALVGLATLGVIYLLARWLDLRLVATLFQGFFAVLVLVLVVVFQDDLRQLFEQIGSWRDRRAAPPASGTADLLARAVARLAANRTGALIVIPGSDAVESHLVGGVELRGRLSEPLLLSLFDTSSPGHDGAVIVRSGSVERFAVHLPLSSDHTQLGPGGTRHAAALGLSERCDALCIAVSEERGTISIARDGTLRSHLRPQDVVEEIASHQPAPAEAGQRWRDRSLWLEAGGSLAVALLLWVALIPGADVSESELLAKVEVANLPPGFRVEAVDPGTLQVRLRGARRDLLLVPPEAVSVRIDADLVRLGRRTFQVTAEHVVHPEPLAVVAIHPDRVKLEVANAAPAPTAEAKPEAPAN